MLVKYINENNVKYANSRIILKYKYKQIINPKDDNFIEAGYKPLEVEEEPIYNVETEYLQSYYIEEEDKVIKKWKIVEIEKEDIVESLIEE